MNEKTYYCSKCGNLVFPKKCYSWFGNLMGLCKRFCADCGQPTDTAILALCEQGHSMNKWKKFCEKCGAKTNFILSPDAQILGKDQEPNDEKYPTHLDRADDIFRQDKNNDL